MTIERYLLAFEAGTLPEDQCGARISNLGVKTAELHDRRAQLFGALDAPVPQPPTAEELDELRVDLSQGLEGTCHPFLSRRATLALPSSCIPILNRLDQTPASRGCGESHDSAVYRAPPFPRSPIITSTRLLGPGPHQPGNGGSRLGGPLWVFVRRRSLSDAAAWEVRARSTISA